MFTEWDSGCTRLRLEGWPVAENGGLIGGAAAVVQMWELKPRAIHAAFRIIMLLLG